jgi:hypothetical protein
MYDAERYGEIMFDREEEEISAEELGLEVTDRYPASRCRGSQGAAVSEIQKRRRPSHAVREER